MANLMVYRNDKDFNDKGSSLFDKSEELLSAKQLASRLGVHYRTIEKWRYERKIPASAMVKVGRLVKYVWSEIVRWLREENE